VLEPFQRIPTTPDTYTGNNTGAEIAVAPSGRFVYASNRGHDTHRQLRSGRTERALERDWLGVRSGSQPRFFCLDSSGNRLYAANRTVTRLSYRRPQRQRPADAHRPGHRDGEPNVRRFRNALSVARLCTASALTLLLLHEHALPASRSSSPDQGFPARPVRLLVGFSPAAGRM
jgi:hypothetical protein